MIFNFRIVSDEVTNFKRELKIDGSATFLDLKNAICDAVDYDKNQMCSFFLCGDDWEKQKEITFEDMDSDSDQDIYLMDECVLSDYLEDEGQKLLFVFDYMTDRALYMELREIQTGCNLSEPLCTLSLGKAPAQMVDIDEFTRDLDDKVAASAAADLTDIDENFYGSESFSDDEFDPDSFNDLTLDD